jgi:hypothetical protein
VDIEYLAPEMRPAGDLGDAVGAVELVVASMAVGLREPGEVNERLLGMTAGAILGELIPDQRRRGGAGAAIVDNIGLDPAGCVLAASRIEHRHGRVVGMDLGGGEPNLADAADNRIEQR